MRKRIELGTLNTKKSHFSNLEKIKKRVVAEEI